MSEKLTEEQVHHVAKLSRLKLTDAQIHHFAEQLTAVLGYIDKLNELDVTDVEPMTRPTEITNRFREDVPTQGIGLEQVLHNAPDADPPYFKVPKVIGDGSSA